MKFDPLGGEGVTRGNEVCTLSGCPRRECDCVIGVRAWRPLSVAAVGNGTNGTGYRPVTAHYPPESALLTDPRALLNYVKSSKVSLWSMTSRFREKITVYVIVANL